MSTLTSTHALSRYQQLTQMDGIVYRIQPNRKTFATVIDGTDCFVKLHGGVGWREIVKNIIQGRLPIIGARTEYTALTHLATHNIASLTVREYGASGCNPATQRSFLVTEALVNTISLEDFCATWRTQPPSLRLKRRLVRALADCVARMHASGLNHRDCYLCHFHLDLTALAAGTIKLVIIDLHRAQIRKRVPFRWQVKDVAGLYFSAMQLGLNWRDYLWFVKHYAQGLNLANAYRFWQAVEKRAYRLFLKSHYHSERSFSHYALFDSAWPARGLPVTMKACETLIQQGVLIKNDATTTVVKTELADGSALLIKRYNVHSMTKLFKRLCRRSRAEKAWLAGIRLTELGFLTPQPLALFEKRIGFFRTESYLLTTFIDGEDIGSHIAHYPAFLQAVIVRQLTAWLTVMKLLRMSHGDMKATNFLWHPLGIYILDLDACRTWSNASRHRKALLKDAKRLAKNNFSV